jgi:hypothetical protein
MPDGGVVGFCQSVFDRGGLLPGCLTPRPGLPWHARLEGRSSGSCGGKAVRIHPRRAARWAETMALPGAGPDGPVVVASPCQAGAEAIFLERLELILARADAS